MARSIVLAVDTDRDADSIITALTTREGLAAFWTPDVHATPEVGAELRFGFPGAPVDLEMTLVALDPGRRVEWECHGPWPHWGGTRVEWTILEGDPRRVVFVQRGWGGDQPDAEFGAVAHTWAMVLTALQNYLRSGVAAPALA
jgi:Activator of Hsp90 ATPase homolog 1-like protein